MKKSPNVGFDLVGHCQSRQTIMWITAGIMVYTLPETNSRTLPLRVSRCGQTDHPSPFLGGSWALGFQECNGENNQPQSTNNQYKPHCLKIAIMAGWLMLILNHYWLLWYLLNHYQLLTTIINNQWLRRTLSWLVWRTTSDNQHRWDLTWGPARQIGPGVRQWFLGTITCDALGRIIYGYACYGYPMDHKWS